MPSRSTLKGSHEVATTLRRLILRARIIARNFRKTPGGKIYRRLRSAIRPRRTDHSQGTKPRTGIRFWKKKFYWRCLREWRTRWKKLQNRAAAAAQRKKFRPGRESNNPRICLRAIGPRRNWTAGDSMEILGELNLYRAIMAKNSAPICGHARAAASFGSRFRRRANAGPFVDRCAFVLDPSMMENARVSSAKVASRN